MQKCVQNVGVTPGTLLFHFNILLLLRSGISIDYHSNQCFTNINMSVCCSTFIICLTILNLTTSFIQDLLFQPNNVHSSHCKKVGGVL